MYKHEDYNLHDYENFDFMNGTEVELNSLDIIHDGQLLMNEEEETLDANIKFTNLSALTFNNLSPRGPPERNAWPGKLNFVVEVNSSDTNKKYLYSHQLNRIYVDMETNFSVQFNWNHEENKDMYVRATTVFSDDSQAEKRVERCIQHEYSPANVGLSPQIFKNILHSSREMGTQGVEYCGEPSIADSWYSVRVLFHKTSPDPVTHAYKFLCKNSCSTGINRRAIAIIFTLEDEIGVVLGRQWVGARVCACPRRDIKKDEDGEGVYRPGSKRVASNRIAPTDDQPANANANANANPSAKKIRIEVVAPADAGVVTLPPLKVVGDKAMIAGLEMMQRMMEQGAELTKSDPHSVAVYKKYLDEFKKSLADLKKQKSDKK